MTATQDKRDDNLEGRNIYEIFHHQLAYEIHLQNAMEEDLLCPFHYFGITDLEIIADVGKSAAEKVENFRYLTSDNRLIAISKSGRSIESEDVQNFIHAKERGIDVQLFVRKNKDDKISKEFYYLGRMTSTGLVKEFVMPNTEKTAVEMEWALDTPVREDIYQYIVNG